MTTMLHWLVGSCRVFGLNGQNWMLVIAGAFVAYFTALALIRRYRRAQLDRAQQGQNA